jgi:hypothetical protein
VRVELDGDRIASIASSIPTAALARGSPRVLAVRGGGIEELRDQ